jgi:formylglycine-generating enzyme required for sulfatase activity
MKPARALLSLRSAVVFAACVCLLPMVVAPSSGSNSSAGAAQPARLAAPFDEQAAKHSQTEWANLLRVQSTAINTIGMKLALIPPGTFMMGSPKTEAGRDADETQHPVTLSKPFMMAIYDVTTPQFSQFVAAEKYQTDAEKRGHAVRWRDREYEESATQVGASWRNPGFQQGDDHPVVCVSMNDAEKFCQWLTQKEGKTYRLPTEAEWEYACRAGTQSAYVWGNDAKDGKDWANCVDQTAKKTFAKWTAFQWDDGFVYTSPVRKFKPNAFGLYDMIGNVWQWCADWYTGLTDQAVTDPLGERLKLSMTTHVLRGGAWNSAPSFARSATRVADGANGSGYNTGFRVVLEITMPKKE